MVRRGALLLIALAVGVMIAGTAQAQAPIEREIQGLFWAITWFALIVAAVVYGLLFYFLIRFRQSVSPPATKPFVHHRGLEITWTIFPTVILIIITAISIPVLFFTDTPPPVDTEVTVIAFQWGWNFTYDDGTSTLNELWIQEDVTVLFRVTSIDVIHSFAIHNLGVKIDAVPGRFTTFWLRADEPGEYFSRCAEFCGVGHYAMVATVRVYEEGSQRWPDGTPKIYGPPVEPPKFTNIELREFGGNATHPWSIFPNNLTFSIGSPVRLKIFNNNSVAYDFRIDLPVSPNSTRVERLSNATLVFLLNVSSPTPVAYGPTDQTARERGMVGELIVESGEVIVILLEDPQGGTAWRVDPALLVIEAGDQVTFELRNIGGIAHNFTMGGVYADVKCETLIEPGETAFCGPFTFEEDASGKYWCNVGGHRRSGMEAAYQVGAGGGPAAEEGIPLFEMTLITFSVGTAATFAYVVHHARRRDE